MEVVSVANIGERPHNPEADYVLNIMSELEQDPAIFMIKPDFFPEYNGMPLQQYIEGMLTSVQLDVLCTSQRTLSPEQVYELYETVLKPHPENDAKYGTEWKSEVVDYISGGEVHAYLLAGEDAENRARIVKNHLRNVIGDSSVASRIVRNVGHVCDKEDFEVTLQHLFL